MAFRSNSPITVSLPPFRGVTRRIILLAVGMFFALALLGVVTREMGGMITALLAFRPASAYKLIWQLVSYPFVGMGILGLLFAALTVWFFGSALEDELGSRWMAEFFFASTIGGALIAGILSFTLLRSVPGLDPTQMAFGLWPLSLALLVVYARLHADQQLNFNFILHVKAKYIAIIYVLVYLAILLSQRDRFDAMLVLTNCLCGWAFVALAPQRGIRFGVQEQVYGLRNAWTRARRRRAAKKFSVYMQKQGREVHFDAHGRYVEPDAKRDPNDRRWMN